MTDEFIEKFLFRINYYLVCKRTYDSLGKLSDYIDGKLDAYQELVDYFPVHYDWETNKYERNI